MDEYPSNSRKASDEEPEKKALVKPKMDKIVEGKVVRRKKSVAKRFTDMFIGGDVDNVLEYVVKDVLVPATKDAISDAITTGIERLIFGESRPTSRRGGSRPGNYGGGYNPYNRYSSSPTRRDRDREREEPRSAGRRTRSPSFDDVVFEKRFEAEEVLDQMTEAVDQYGQVTVLDFYNLCGEPHDFTQERWGWEDVRDLKHVTISNLRGGGYVINLPKPVLLEK